MLKVATSGADTTRVKGGLSDADVLRHIRQTVFVLDEYGTVLQAAGSSMGIAGIDVTTMVGRNALDFVAPEYFEPMLFVFSGPGDHVVRDRHAPFPIGLIDNDGNTFLADCAAERVVHDGQTLWVVTLMPHTLQSASFHALAAHSRGASAVEVANAIGERLAWQWDTAAEIRSFVLSCERGERFDTVVEPGASSESSRLLEALAHEACNGASWLDLDESNIVLPVSELPEAVASAALNAGFQVACLAVATCFGAPSIGVVSFGVHAHAFRGNLELIIDESIRTLELTMQREVAAEVLRRAAEHDPLTGLANRHSFTEVLETRGSSGQPTALLYIDVDEFKAINDSYGHTVGDSVLMEIARRISSTCGPDDNVARLGGDEFAVLIADTDEAGATAVAQRVLDRIAEPLPVGIGPTQVTASGGLALPSQHRNIVERADLAMLDGKRAGRSQLVIT